jgi:hypothetical protein
MPESGVTHARKILRAMVHVLGHVATTVVGVVSVIVGLGLTMTAVFVIAGIVTMVVGVSLIVGGVFAHDMGGP